MLSPLTTLPPFPYFALSLPQRDWSLLPFCLLSIASKFIAQDLHFRLLPSPSAVAFQQAWYDCASRASITPLRPCAAPDRPEPSIFMLFFALTYSAVLLWCFPLDSLLKQLFLFILISYLLLPQNHRHPAFSTADQLRSKWELDIQSRWKPAVCSVPYGPLFSR